MYEAFTVWIYLALRNLGRLLVSWLALVSSIWRPPIFIPTVELDYATYVGVNLGQQHLFLGMRYAKPPLGERRWRAPEYPPSTVPIIQDASKFGSSCHAAYDAVVSPGSSEDCLFVNVWTPANRDPDELLPVLFWLHGGGYLAGTSSYYPGTHLVEASGNSMLFVSINYRLAQFGFLSSIEIEEDGDLNVGLLDQYVALRWVQDYISHFGGDPDQVTIWGESAGAGSVAMQLLAYGGTSDLFRAAVGNSIFFPYQPLSSDPSVRNTFMRYAALTGCDTYPNETMSCLRSREEDILLLAGSVVSREHPSMFAYPPVVDGNFLRDHPISAFQRGNFKKVPTIMGYNTNEGTSFAWQFRNPIQQPTLDTYLTNQFPNISNSTLHEVHARYPPSAYNDSLAYSNNTLFGRAAAIYGEAVFICQVPLISGMQAEAGMPSYSYRFNRTEKKLPDGYGTPHGVDVPLFFGMPSGDPTDTGYDDLSHSIQAYLTSFVRTTSPNTFKRARDVRWPLAGSEYHRQLRLEENNTLPERMPIDQVERCRFWWSKAHEMQF